MPSAQQPAGAFGSLPDPGRAGTLDDLVEQLRLLKVWAGDPSYEWIKEQVNAAWTASGRPAGELAGKTTVVDCFRPGRRRLNTDLVVAVVAALHPDAGYVTQWRQALQVIGGRAEAAAQVRVQDALPPDLAGFTGRNAEVERLCRALRSAANGDPSAVSAIAGMAGVGKTQLAVHAAHLFAQEQPPDRVLFVNLRGFHADAGQPPADPAAVLDGFLRLLGMPGQQIPHTLSGRTAAYRQRLAGTRTLVVLDNAADAEQVRPLLPEVVGCPVLVTSRRTLAAPQRATHVSVDVFTPDEALGYLARAVPDIPVGADRGALARIARRCGHLPLALGLVAAHMRGKPGWTLTDHADRLDERRQRLHLDSGVELALDLSYQHLSGDRQRLLRLVALHPGQDFDAYAAAALAGTDLPTAGTQLADLCRDQLLQLASAGRYTLHDLVRAYATGRANDEDRPPDRRAALTRLFDYYLAAGGSAMDTLYPAEAHRRPRIPAVASPVPVLSDPDTALAWLDIERPVLLAVCAHTAGYGWPSHATRLAGTLYRYLAGGYHADALAVHGHALTAARGAADRAGEADALSNLGAAHLMLGGYGAAAANLEQALHLYREVDRPVGQARALINLGVVDAARGRYRSATEYYERSLALFRRAGDTTGEAHALGNLGDLEARLGRSDPAITHHERALTLFRQAGDRTGEAWVLSNLGEIDIRLGRYATADDHLQQALHLYRQLANRTGEAAVLDNLGVLGTRLGRPRQAVWYHQRALVVFRETGDREGEAGALNGLGEAARALGRPAEALAQHQAALGVAGSTGDHDAQARAHTGIGHAYHTLANPVRAGDHYQHALALYTELGTPDVEQVRTHLGVVTGALSGQRR